MITVELRENIYALADVLGKYQQETGKTASHVLARNMPKLTFFLKKFYGELKPGKGAIRAELEGRLAVGLGVNVRRASAESAIAKLAGRASIKVRGKHLNVQALAVKAEIGTRSRGRGFLAWSWAIRKIRDIDIDTFPGDTIVQPHFSKISGFLAKATLRQQGQASTLSLANEAESFTATARRKTSTVAGADPALSVAGRALNAVRADVVVYLERKAAERLSKYLAAAARAVPRLVSA